jgi:hypothetical protein
MERGQAEVTREEMAERIAEVKQRQARDRSELDIEHQRQRDRLAVAHGREFDDLYRSMGGRRERTQ